MQNEGFPGGNTYRGPDAILDGVFKRNDSLWDDFHFEIESMHATEDVVTVIGHYTGKEGRRGLEKRNVREGVKE